MQQARVSQEAVASPEFVAGMMREIRSKITIAQRAAADEALYARTGIDRFTHPRRRKEVVGQMPLMNVVSAPAPRPRLDLSEPKEHCA